MSETTSGETIGSIPIGIFIVSVIIAYWIIGIFPWLAVLVWDFESARYIADRLTPCHRNTINMDLLMYMVLTWAVWLSFWLWLAVHRRYSRRGEIRMQTIIDD